MASKKEKALGSGLGALFGSEQPLAPEKLPISKVEPRSGQPRTRFDEPRSWRWWKTCSGRT